MKKKPAMELVAALRSGKYRQTAEKLHGASNTYCCLGVACEISGLGTYGNLYRGSRSYLIPESEEDAADILPRVVQEHFGFHNDIGERKDTKCLKFGDQEFDCLAEANDGGIPFKDIADYIEKNWRHL